MSLRDKFQFEYSGAVLAEAAERKRDHHEERMKWWEGELEKAKDAFRGSSVEFHEYDVTGGTRLDAVINPTAKRRLDECHGKVREHREQMEDYRRWARGFRANAGAAFALDPADIAYFGL